MFYINKMLPFSDQGNQYFNNYILLRKKLMFYKLTFIEKNILHKVVIIMIWSCHAFYISMLYLHLFLVTDKYIACFQKSNFLTVYINRLTSLWSVKFQNFYIYGFKCFFVFFKTCIQEMLAYTTARYIFCGVNRFFYNLFGLGLNK